MQLVCSLGDFKHTGLVGKVLSFTILGVVWEDIEMEDITMANVKRKGFSDNHKRRTLRGDFNRADRAVKAVSHNLKQA